MTTTPSAEWPGRLSSSLLRFASRPGDPGLGEGAGAQGTLGTAACPFSAEPLPRFLIIAGLG